MQEGDVISQVLPLPMTSDLGTREVEMDEGKGSKASVSGLTLCLPSTQLLRCSLAREARYDIPLVWRIWVKLVKV